MRSPTLIAWFVITICLVQASLVEARYYDPKTGTYLQEDPMSSSMTEPQQQNAYAYAQNRPTIFIDPYGQLIFGRKDAEKAFLENFDKADPQGLFSQEERSIMARKFVDEINEVEGTRLKAVLKSGDTETAGEIAGNVYERIKKKAIQRGHPDDIALLRKIEQAESAGVCILPGGATNPAPDSSGGSTPIPPQ